MKGIILAGGTGSRLAPITEVTNKHLLPVYDWPMIFYPINTLKGGGITDICIVLGGNSIGDTVNLCGDGSRFGVNLTYKHQKGVGGIAEALLVAEDFVDDSDVAVILGDNVFLRNICLTEMYIPTVCITDSKHPQDFGCIEYGVSSNGSRYIERIVEKPLLAPSSKIVVGLYIYSGRKLFDMIRTLNYSERNELEITDLNNELNKSDCLDTYEVPQDTWYDAGSFDSILSASKAVKKWKGSGAYVKNF